MLTNYPMPLHLILLAMITVLLLAGCSGQPPPPPIGRDLPRGVGYTSAFNDRITQHFPAGSDESKFMVELRNEQFAITETHDSSGRNRLSATYHVHSVMCIETWTVQWIAAQGKIEEIQGKKQDLCP